MAKTYNELMARARGAGSNLKEVCRRAGVNYQSVCNWKGRDPKSIQIYRRLDETLTELEDTKTGAGA